MQLAVTYECEALREGRTVMFVKTGLGKVFGHKMDGTSALEYL
jgi:hypothetical protein